MTRTIGGTQEAELQEEIERLRGEVERLEAKVAELDCVAHMDAMLPVANRRGLTRQLEMALARHARFGTPSALLFVDVDGLKQLNDSYGHSAGDAALAHIAALMLNGVRQTDLVARLGGDEFAILLDHAGPDEARETAIRLTCAIADKDFTFQGHVLPVSVAIGVAMIEEGDSAESVFDRADKEMYREKAA